MMAGRKHAVVSGIAPHEVDMDMNIIVIATPATPPAPWRSGWELSRLEIQGLPGRLHVARAPRGTPIPTPGITRVIEAPGWRPKPSARQADAVREHYQRQAELGDSLHAELAAAILANPSKLAKETERAIGVPDAHAWHAPLSMTLRQACSAMARAGDQWSSETACGVIRAALSGYETWTGIGGRMASVGSAPTYEAAEELLVEASLARRRDAAERVVELLRGWSHDTPCGALRLGDLPDAVRRLPLSIYRGPIAGGGQSSDLPHVATWRDGVFERHAVAITWDDERDRAEMSERRAAGERRAAELRAQRRAREN